MTEHRAWTESSGDRVRALLEGEVLADSTATMILHETGLEPVRYFPPGDVRSDLLRPTDHHTYCPIKGTASYYSVSAGGTTAENAAWYYPEPLPDAAGVPGYLAFYPRRVQLTVG